MTNKTEVHLLAVDASGELAPALDVTQEEARAQAAQEAEQLIQHLLAADPNRSRHSLELIRTLSERAFFRGAGWMHDEIIRRANRVLEELNTAVALATMPNDGTKPN